MSGDLRRIRVGCCSCCCFITIKRRREKWERERNVRFIKGAKIGWESGDKGEMSWWGSSLSLSVEKCASYCWLPCYRPVLPFCIIRLVRSLTRWHSNKMPGLLRHYEQYSGTILPYTPLLSCLRYFSVFLLSSDSIFEHIYATQLRETNCISHGATVNIYGKLRGAVNKG